MAPENFEQMNTRERMEGLYKRAVETEQKMEIRKTIDIFSNPLLLRKDNGILSLLELERRKRIKSPGNTKNQLIGSHPAGFNAWFGSDVVCLSMPVPWIKKVGSEHDDEESKKQKIIQSLLKINPTLKESAIRHVLDRATSLGNYSRIHEKSLKESISDIREVNLIKEILEDEELRKVWLTFQKTWFTGDDDVLDSIGEHTYVAMYARTPSENRSGTFLISPESGENYVVDPVQSGDYTFEMWGVNPINAQDIKGFIKKTDKFSKGSLSETIEKEEMYGFLDYYDGIDKPKEAILKMIERIKSNRGWNGSRLKKEERQETIERICYFLDMAVDSFSLEILEKDIDEIPGVFFRYYGEMGMVKRPETKGGKITDFPDIDTERLTIKQIKDDVYSRLSSKLEKLFPFQNFGKETLTSDTKEAIMKYIKDKFKIDPEKTTTEEFIELIVKRMGIPIYDLNGNQIWPERKSHAEIERSDSQAH